MPSKFKTKKVPLTWNFSPAQDYLLDRSGPLSSKKTGGAPRWGQTGLLWTTGVVYLIKSIGGSRGGVRTDSEKWNAWDNLNPKNKRKLIRVLFEIQGIKYEKQQQLKEYVITIDNINLLVDEYEKWQKNQITIKNVILEEDQHMSGMPDSVDIEI